MADVKREEPPAAAGDDDLPPPLSPELIPLRSTAGPYVCVACCAEGQLSDAHFDCVNDPKHTHSQCLQCFTTYVGVCCEQSSSSNTIPVKCPIPACAAPVPVHTLAALILQSDLINKPQKPLMKRYEQAQLQVALFENIHKKQGQETVITCHLCGEYSEIFVPPPADYWRQIELRRQGMIEALESGPEKMELMNKQSRVLQRVQEIQSDYARKTADINIVTTFAKRKVALDKILNELKDSPITDDMAATVVNPGLTFEEKKEMFVFRGDPFLKSAVFDKLREVYDAVADMDPDCWKSRLILRKIYEIADSMSIEGDDDMKELNSLEQFYIRKRDEEVAAVQAEGRAAEKAYAKNFAEKMKKLKEASTAEELDLIAKSINANNADVELSQSTKFFACRNNECTGAQCIACDKRLKKEEIKVHTCEANDILLMYFMVTNTLAKAATRLCWNCGTPGMKDLACTHITCGKCGKRWCYHCEFPEDKLKGGFSSHNTWTLRTPDEEGRCPMYLHYKYGDRPNNTGELMEGDPAKALMAFHAILQIKAIKDLQNKTDPVLWENTMKAYFPQGIFAINDVKIEFKD